MLWLKLLIIMTLTAIAFEDFRFRRVRLIFYLMLFVFVSVYRIRTEALESIFLFLCLNLTYLALLLFVCACYVNLKTGSFKGLGGYIGVGDILFLIALAGWFELIQYILFNVISFVVALVTHTVFKRFSFYHDWATIPLAGIQAVCFFVVLAFNIR